MALVDARVTLWEALAGRAPGQPTGPADSGLWSAVVERINPAKARPRLRPGIEEASLVSARGVPYVMLRSPDRAACYLRLTPQEWALAGLMDGRRTLARLVAEFARISGRLAPEQVRRVVADLAGNRMLEELPVDAFRPLTRFEGQGLDKGHVVNDLLFRRVQQREQERNPKRKQEQEQKQQSELPPTGA